VTISTMRRRRRIRSSHACGFSRFADRGACGPARRGVQATFVVGALIHDRDKRPARQRVSALPSRAAAFNAVESQLWFSR
jgi:hypothetical protein